MKLSDITEEIDKHINRINAIKLNIEEWLPLHPNDFEEIKKITIIDSFIYRFIKVQDKMGEKLFPEVLKILQEYKSNMPLIDILNTLERLELIESADKWIEYRKLKIA